MCGRYSLIADIGDLAQQFEFGGDGDVPQAAFRPNSPLS